MNFEPTCPPPEPNTRPPGFTPPPGSCDTHCHVFGPSDRFPYSDKRSYTPHDSPLDDFRKLQQVLGLDRAVIVQASCQGSDNSTVLDAIARSDGRYRGIAMVDDSFTDADYEKLNAGGVRGVRFSFIQRHGNPPDAARIRRAADMTAPLGWHIVIHAGVGDVTENADVLTQLPVPVVIDHMAKASPVTGVEEPGFQTLLSILRNEDFWMKVSGADRNSAQGPPYDDTVPFAQALIEAAPDRILWGTDWPHPNLKAVMPNDGDLLDLLARYAPDEALRKRILVDNPARLYGFDS